MKCHIHMPRQALILEAVETFTRNSNISWPTFTSRVVEHYQSNIAPGNRNIEFSKNPDSYKKLTLDGQTLTRAIYSDKPARHFPCELEESLVAALPNEYRLPLLSELAARYGLLATPIPGNDSSCPVSLANMCTEFAGVIESMGPLIADGTLENDSLRDLLNAQREARELMAVLAGWTAQIDSTIQHKQGRVV